MSEKKLSISKKSILIASALVLAIGIPTAYYLITNSSEQGSAWYSSSWLYRRSISVANSGSTLTNEDVLIEYDTATLISAGKLQSDCDDLRFVDSDDSTALAYWVEGGCNTSTTHIWVRIPSLPSGGKTIYMYYGNSSATNSEQTWTGKFYLMKTSSCDTGWTTESNSGGDFFERFPKGSSSFGTKSGSSSHSHTDTTLTTGYESAAGGIVKNTSNVYLADTHTHQVTLTSQSTSILPPYLDMIFCSNSDLVVKQNLVTLFDSTVPTGFTRYSNLDSKFPRGNSAYGGTGTTTTHTHTISATNTGAPSATTTRNAGTTSYSPSDTHTHSVSSFTSGNGTHIPEYITMIYGQASADIMVPFATVVMTNAAPPLGWTRFTALDAKYPYGSSSYGTTGGAATHTHAINTSVNNYVGITGVGDGKPNIELPVADTHNHTLVGNLVVYSNDPLYTETLFYKKKTSQSVTINNEELPNQAPNAPTGLLTEGYFDPNGVSDTTPEFTAIYSDPDSDDGTHYEIEVNTQSDFQGTYMWDTGKIATSPIKSGTRSPEFSYTGSTLTLNGATYYWRIRFWDTNNNVSTWSNTSQFSLQNSLLTKGLTGDGFDIGPMSIESQSYYSESTAESTWSTDTTYQDKTTMTFTPESNSTYLIIASWLMRQTRLRTGYYVQGKLTRTTGTAKDFNELIYYPKDATDYISGGTIGIDTFGESPTSQTYKIQYRTTSTSSVARIKEAKMIALKLDTNIDKYAESETRTTTTSTTYQDKTTLTFTPASTGDYIILASATLDGSSASYDYRAQLTIDGTAYSTTNIETNLATNRELWFVLKKVNLSAASHTIKIQYSSESSAGTTGIADARIVAIRADRFLNNYYGENETRATTTSTSYQTYLTLTDTPQATDHLILAVEDLDASSTSYSTYGQALKGATTYGEMLREAKDATGRGMQYFTLKKETLTNSSTSWYLQYRSENAAATAGINNGRILVLELTEPSINVSSYGTQVSTVSPSTSNFFVGGAFTFIRDASTDTVTSITVSETGTISDSNISGLILYYKQEATCSSSIPGDATQFNSTPGTFSSGSSTVTGSMSVGTSQICLYAEMDVGSASIGNSIELQITNPSTQITASRAVTPATAVAISGTTTVSSINTNPNTPSSLLTESSTNPTKVTDTTPEFSAIFTDINPSDTGTYYQIEVNTQSDFLGTTIWDSTKTSTGPITNGSRSSNISYAGTTLTINGTTYYWRMKFWDNNGGESSWSSTAQFTMSGPPSAPSSPKVDGSTNPTQIFSTTPEFTALHSDPNGDNAVYYEIEVNSNSSFTGTVIWDTNKTAMTSTATDQYMPDVTYAGTALTGDSNITYYWRIRFWDSDDNVSDWSTTATFTDFVQEEQYIQMEGVLLERLKIN